MSCLKRPLDGQDPDYEDTIPHETKRLRLLEKNAKVEFSQRIASIIQNEFSTELTNRERDVYEIEERLHQALKWLHMLRYAIVSAFYNKKEVQSGSAERQRRIHPAVKKLIGKEPRNWKPLQQRPSKYRPVVTTCEKEPTVSKEVSSTKENEKKETVSKVPRYIPPKSSTDANSITLTSPLRGMHHKVKKRIVIGNISKWLPVDNRQDSASHKWMMYVRGPREAPDVSDFVSKVRFFLHPSYRPHDIVEMTSPPFHLPRRGWGEFPLRVQIHFCHSRNKPVDVIHHLKLDRTYTGLQTLGAETVVDIWLYSGTDSSSPGNENEVISTKEGVSGFKSDTSEQLAEVAKLNNDVYEVVSTEESVSGGNSDASEQLAHIVKVNDNVNEVVSTEESVFGGNSGASEQLVEVVQVNDGANSTVSWEVCDSPAKEVLPGLIKPKMEPVDNSECIAPCDDKSQLDASGHGWYSSSDTQFSSLDHDYFGVMNVDIKKESEDDCHSDHSVPDCSQENVSEACRYLCKVKSSVEVDSSVENHMMEAVPVVQENKVTNCIPHTVEAPTKSVAVNNHIEHNVSSTENNSKLTTLVKCMDKNGHVVYLTLGQTHPKPHVKLASVVPTSEQSVYVTKSTSLLNKQQIPHAQLHNKLLPTAVVTSGLKVKSALAKPVLSNYNCKGKDGVISQGNSCMLVTPQGTAGSVITIQSNAHNALSLETNSSSLVTAQQTSALIPSQGTNVKPGVKVTSPVISTNNSSELLKQLQNNSGQLLSLLKLNATMPATNKLEEGNKAGDSKASGQNASTSVQDQSFLIIKNGQLYLLKHVQNSATVSVLAAKSSAKQCDSIQKQRSILLTDSKSLLSSPVRSVKGGISLLKKQASAQVPQSMLSPSTVKPQDMDKSQNARLLISGRSLVLNKANSRHITQSNKIRYGEALSVAIESCKFDDVAVAVRWLLRHMPLVSPAARDVEFRVVHPYAASSEDTFLQWNIGKRRAAEWLRAKAVQRVLQERFPKARVWCTYAIVVWARLHGYTPALHPAEEVTEDVPSGPTARRTYSEPVAIMDWLVTNHKSDHSSGTESDDEVDVVGIESLQTKATTKQGPSQFEEIGSSVEVLELDRDLEAQCLFVRETAREVGFKFPPQEIIPGMLFCAAERVLLEAVRSLADDLLRRALYMAWQRNSNRPPGCITLDDVRTAILTRPEFDLFSNRGLGVQLADTG